MPRFSVQIVCPNCKQSRMQRIERKSWMRNFTSSKLYHCKDCGSRVLQINRWLRLRLGSEPVGKRSEGARSALDRGSYEQVLKALTQMNREELTAVREAISVMLAEPADRNSGRSS
jgi:DNA-directed RNA polymerase subunit RPC12/RpoP